MQPMSQPISLGRVLVTVDSQGDVPIQPESREIVPSTRDVSLADAVRSSGFRVLQPEVLPPGLQLDRVQQVVDPSQASAVLAAVLVYNQRSPRWVTIRQQPAGGIRQLKTRSTPQPATVAGRPAAFFTWDLPLSSRPGDTLRILRLYAEVGEVLVTVSGASLALDGASTLMASLR